MQEIINEDQMAKAILINLFNIASQNKKVSLIPKPEYGPHCFLLESEGKELFVFSSHPEMQIEDLYKSLDMLN